MALKYKKHIETNTTYIFTGFDFERACFEAGVNKYRMDKMSRHRIYPLRYDKWIAMGAEVITVDENTMDLILEVLEQSSKETDSQQAAGCVK